MMDFCIAHFGTPDWFNYKTEIIYGLYHSLTRLGHDVVIKHNDMDAYRKNIIIGADWLAQTEVVQNLLDSQINYTIFEVEAFDGRTINHREDFNSQAYLMLILGADFVFTPYSYNMGTYQKMGLGEKIKYLPWGFYEEVVDPNIVFSPKLMYDLVFFGLLKGAREGKVKQLQNLLPGRVGIVDQNLPFEMRPYFLSRSKFALSLSSGAIEHFVNPFRIVYLEANGLEVVTDSQLDEDGYLRNAQRMSVSEMSDFILGNTYNRKRIEEKAREINLISGLINIFD
jgi:hypothetical protein